MEWKNTTFLLKQREKYLELPLKHFVTGIIRVKSILLDLHPEYDYTISKTYRTLLVSILLFNKKKKLLTVELVPKNKWTILSDKKIFSDENTLIISWLQTSVQGLTGKEKALKPFWTDRCKEISQKLWLPTETDSVDSHSNSLKESWNRTGLNSLFWIKKNTNPETMNSQKTFYPSFIFIPVDKWGEDGIKSRKIRIYPTQEQKKIIKQWIGTSRYVYNRVLDAAKKGEKINFYELRNKYVIAKNNPIINDWEKDTPKDIRAGAVKDMTIAFKAAITNLKKGNITHFNLGFRSKKKESSIEIPKTAIKFKSNKLFIYSTFIKDGIKLSKDKSLKKLKIDHDCRLQNENGRWYIYIPIKSNIEYDIPEFSACALDPGIRKFQTVYSENMSMKIGVNKDLLRELQRKLDTFQSLRSRKLIKKSHYNRRRTKIMHRFSSLIDDMQFQTVSYLTKTFKTIFLPTFESQEIVKKNKIKVVRRDLLNLRHYRFKQRLLDKCNRKRYCVTRICTEEYTTKTCGLCGNLTCIGNREIFKCDHCHFEIDRDDNASRNIFIKSINETW